MASRKIIFCDKCKSEKPCKRLMLPIRRYCDAAGSMDTDYDGGDFCLECFFLMVKYLTEKLSYEDGAEFVRRWKKP